MRTTSLASVGRIRRSTTLASMTRLLLNDPATCVSNELYISDSACQRAPPLGFRLSARLLPLVGGSQHVVCESRLENPSAASGSTSCAVPDEALSGRS